MKLLGNDVDKYIIYLRGSNSMIYNLCAAHRAVDCTNHHELLRYNINMQALGFEPFGPTRRIEAASEEDAKYIFLKEYSKDFDLIECFDGGACLLWKSDCKKD